MHLDGMLAEGNPRLSELLERKKKLEAKIAQLDAAEKEKKRKRETRLKIIVGGCVLADIMAHPEGAAVIEQMLKRAASAKDKELLRAEGWRV